MIIIIVKKWMTTKWTLVTLNKTCFIFSINSLKSNSLHVVLEIK